MLCHKQAVRVITHGFITENHWLEGGPLAKHSTPLGINQICSKYACLGAHDKSQPRTSDSPWGCLHLLAGFQGHPLGCRQTRPCLHCTLACGRQNAASALTPGVSGSGSHPFVYSAAPQELPAQFQHDKVKLHPLVIVAPNCSAHSAPPQKLI
jgi:hypothetical protein